MVLTVGLLADTHGLLREQVLEVFAGVDHIVHAGDIGCTVILDALGALAPATAVWGNVDGPELRAAVPEHAVVELAGVAVIVSHHREAALGAAAASKSRRLVVFGHSHVPSTERRDDMLLVNPGSAGRRRFRLPVSVALARVGHRTLDAEIVELDA